MPYIKKLDRTKFYPLIYDIADKIKSEGELNYAITCIILEYLNNNRPNSYALLNKIIGVLECIKQEFYRRMVIPYEEKKIEENGEVYP